MNQELTVFLRAALECTVYISPNDIGLTYEELLEAGRVANYFDGEINDSIRNMVTTYFGRPAKIFLSESQGNWLPIFREEPDYRNFEAFDFLVSELNHLVRTEGAAKAAISREVLVERGVAKEFSRHDVEVSITYLKLGEIFSEDNGFIRFRQQGVHTSLANMTANNTRPFPKPQRARAYPIVKDIIERRTDGRSLSPEPLRAFAETVEKLGYRSFRGWWAQTVAELGTLEPAHAPVSATVLAAALVEGALTFVVRHGRSVGHFQSRDYQRDPKTWSINDLVASAAGGGPSSILPSDVKARAEGLIRARQRIHAGRLLSEYPGGPPDLRPDEARDAKTTAERVVRAILDWIDKNPIP